MALRKIPEHHHEIVDSYVHRGDRRVDYGTIDSLIDTLQTAKGKGATHYFFELERYAHDSYDFKQFDLYRVRSAQEVKLLKIKALEAEIAKIRAS